MLPYYCQSWAETSENLLKTSTYNLLKTQQQMLSVLGPIGTIFPEESKVSWGSGWLSNATYKHFSKATHKDAYTILVLHSDGDVWVSFCAAVSRGPSQTSGCFLGTLQQHGAGATSKSIRLHLPRGWFQPNAENYVMFAKILMRVTLQC